MSNLVKTTILALAQSLSVTQEHTTLTRQPQNVRQELIAQLASFATQLLVSKQLARPAIICEQKATIQEHVKTVLMQIPAWMEWTKLQLVTIHILPSKNIPRQSNASLDTSALVRKLKLNVVQVNTLYRVRRVAKLIQ